MGASYSTIHIEFPRTDGTRFSEELYSNESKEERINKLMAALADFKQNAAMVEGNYQLDLDMPSGFFSGSDEVLSALKEHSKGVVVRIMNMVYYTQINVNVHLGVSNMYMVDSANNIRGTLTPVFNALGFSPVFSFSN